MRERERKRRKQTDEKAEKCEDGGTQRGKEEDAKRNKGRGMKDKDEAK